MRANVYFTREITPEKVVELYRALGVELPGKVAVKVHSGEKGNQNFLRPEFWCPMVEEVHGTIVECNTAYGVDKRICYMEQHFILLRRSHDPKNRLCSFRPPSNLFQSSFTGLFRPDDPLFSHQHLRQNIMCLKWHLWKYLKLECQCNMYNVRMLFQISVIVATAIPYPVTVFIKCHTWHQHQSILILTDWAVHLRLHDAKASRIQIIQTIDIIIIHDTVSIHTGSSHFFMILPCTLHQKTGLNLPLSIHIGQQQVCVLILWQTYKGLHDLSAILMECPEFCLCSAFFDFCPNFLFSHFCHIFHPDLRSCRHVPEYQYCQADFSHSHG